MLEANGSIVGSTDAVVVRLSVKWQRLNGELKCCKAKQKGMGEAQEPRIRLEDKSGEVVSECGREVEMCCDCEGEKERRIGRGTFAI